MSFTLEKQRIASSKYPFAILIALGMATLFFSEARAQDEPVMINLDTVDYNTVKPITPLGDTLANTDVPESLRLTQELSKVDPHKATMLSALLPGLGQAYNRQIWKAPIYYGAFVAIGHMIYTNDRLYNVFRQSLFAEVDNDPTTVNPFPRFQETSLRRNTDNFRRNRDYMIIIASFVYLLNIADAHIGAHLREFDINDELAIDYQPTVGTLGGFAYAGVGVTISF